MLVVPFADVDVNIPGVMATVVAPLVSQIRVLLAPKLMPAGLAVKEVMAGAVPLSDAEVDAPQPSNPAKLSRAKSSAPKLRAEK
jgi:hypothetical protein